MLSTLKEWAVKIAIPAIVIAVIIYIFIFAAAMTTIPKYEVWETGRVQLIELSENVYAIQSNTRELRYITYATANGIYYEQLYFKDIKYGETPEIIFYEGDFSNWFLRTFAPDFIKQNYNKKTFVIPRGTLEFSTNTGR